MTTLEERVSRLEGAYEQLDQRLGDIQTSLNRIDARINALTIAMITGGIAIAGAIVTLAFRI